MTKHAKKARGGYQYKFGDVFRFFTQKRDPKLVAADKAQKAANAGRDWGNLAAYAGGSGRRRKKKR